jgi:TP901 family phage tail tape measure protein
MSHHFSIFSLNFTQNQTKMAKTISDEQMKLSIIINGNSAQKEINDLEKATIKLKHANSDLAYEQKMIAKQLGKDSQEYKKLTAEMKANSLEIEQKEAKIKELISNLKLTDRTMEQLTKQSSLLTRQLKLLDPNSADFKKYSAELSEVKTRMSELSGKAAVAKSSVGSLADSFNRYQGMAIAAVAAVTGVALSIQKIIDINGKLSDSQADVMKTTGMTKDEVDELTKSFGLLKTRTSRIDLLGIAEQGGRIGIAKAEIGDFVNVMNKAAVSLGDSFTGGVEEVANKLGKIKFLFQETKDLNVDQAYNSIGSAINDLGANGVASENNIAEFTTRIGSLPDLLKPSIQETLALGAAFEESGVEAEISARAYGIFLKQASTETAKFAEVMGISEKKVKDMINANPLEFMLNFSKGLKEMSDKGTDVASTLDYLGISADGANKVIGAMGNNTARFRELIELSNNSFASGTSLINEYNIKNNNLAATLDKISKTVSGWFSSETFIKWLTACVQALARMIGATDEANDSINSLADKFLFLVKIFVVATVALISHRAALMLTTLITQGYTEAIALSTIAQKAWNLTTTTARFISGLFTGTLHLMRIAWILMSQGTAAATAELQIFNVATKLNPLGAFITLLMACVAAYVAFSDSAERANETLENQVLINNKVTEQLSDQKQKVSDLVAIMKDENATIDQKKEALKQLQKIAGGYLDTLTQENIATDEGTRLIGRYIAAIEELSKVQAIQDVKAELRKEKLKQDNKVLALSQEKNATKNEGSSLAGDDGKWFGMGSRNKMEIDLEIAEEKKKAENLGFQITALENTKTRAVTEIQAAIRIRNEKLKKVKKDSQQFKELTQSIKNDEKALNILIGLESGKEETPTGPKFNPKGGTKKVGDGKGGKKDANSTSEEINRRKIDDQTKYNEQLLKLTRQLEDDKIEAMQDGYEKELLIENKRYTREIEDLNRQKVHTDELAKLDQDIAKAKESKNIALYNSLLIIRKGRDERNLALDAKIDAIKEGKLAIHNIKLATIEEKAAKDSIENSKKDFDQAKIIRQTKYNEELDALGNNKKAKAKLKKEYEATELEQETIFLKELIEKFNTIVGKGKLDNIDLSLLTPEQVASFTAEAAKVGLSLSELIAKKNELAGKTAGTDFGILQGQGTDIFGFSPEQWNSAFSNFDTMEEKIAAVSTVLGGLQNAYSMYSSFVEANSKKKLQDLDKEQTVERTKLKNQLDKKQITQAQYDKKIKKLDDEKEKAQDEAEYKRAKNEKIAALFSIGVNTATGVMKAVAASPLTGGLPWSAIIGGLGVLQAGMVLKQPLPAKGHEEGLYQDYVVREQDGKRFKSTYEGKTRSGLVSKTSHFLVAENGPEMVIDNKAWRQMNPAVKDSLIRELRGIKGFEQGLYNQEKMRVEVPATPTPSTAGNDAQMMQMMFSLLSENVAVLKELRDKGVVGIITNKDLQAMGYLKDGINAYNELRNKNKK